MSTSQILIIITVTLNKLLSYQHCGWIFSNDRYFCGKLKTNKLVKYENNKDIFNVLFNMYINLMKFIQNKKHLNDFMDQNIYVRIHIEYKTQTLCKFNLLFENDSVQESD